MLKTELGIQLDKAAKEALARNYVYHQTIGHMYHTVLKHYEDQFIYKKRKVPKTPEEREALRKEDEIFALQRKANPQLPVHGPQNTTILDQTHRLKDYTVRIVRVFRNVKNPPTPGTGRMFDRDDKFLAYTIEEFIHNSEEESK